MLFSVWMHIRYECRRQIGRALSLVRLHRLQFLSLNGVDIVRKRRTWLAQWLIPPGNLFLKFSGSPVVALSTKHWLDWERAIDRATGQNRVFPADTLRQHCDRDLISRKVHGTSLHAVLSNPLHSLSQKREAIRLSLLALRTLHQCHADWGDGRHQSVSHGDATSQNVIVDLDRATACWIDFDTRHHPEIIESDRHADDLRALIASSAVDLPESAFPELANLIKEVLTVSEVVEQFRMHLVTTGVDLTTFQFAQSPLPRSRLLSLQTAIQRAFNPAD